MKLQEAIGQFLTSRRSRGCVAGSLADYEKRLRWFKAYLATQGIEDITAITQHVLEGYIDHERERPKQQQDSRQSAVSIHKGIKSLRTFFIWASLAGLISTDPTARLDIPKVGRRLPKALKPFQIMRLLQTPMDERELAIVCLLLDTGLRLSEMTGLDLSDVDLIGTSVLVRAGKGDKDRVAVFASRTAEILRQWLAVRRASADTLAFFVDFKQQHLRSQAAYRMIKRIAQRAQLGDVLHPHTLRHTMATQYLDAGGAIQDLSALLGHTTLAMTMKYVSISTASLHRKHERFSPIERMYQAPLPEMLVKPLEVRDAA